MTGPDSEELFDELYADDLSDCPSDLYKYIVVIWKLIVCRKTVMNVGY